MNTFYSKYMISDMLNFLNLLSKNNTREWFDLNRANYEVVKNEFKSLSKDIAIRVSEFDSSIDPDNSIYFFRINRDTRFSKDKTPYKTNLGAFMTPNALKQNEAGYYIHLQPQNSFVGGGIHMPDNVSLDKIRKYILKHEGEFRDIYYSKKINEKFGGFESEMMLKNVPRGFDKNSSVAEFLKYKSFTVGTQMHTESISNKEFVDIASQNFKYIHPLVNFMNTALKK